MRKSFLLWSLLAMLSSANAQSSDPQLLFRRSLGLAADRLVLLQDSNGEWVQNVTDLNDASEAIGPGAPDGLAAQALFDSWQVTGDPAYQQAVILTAERLNVLQSRGFSFEPSQLLFLKAMGDANFSRSSIYAGAGIRAFADQFTVTYPDEQSVFAAVADAQTSVSGGLAQIIEVFQAYGNPEMARNLIEGSSNGLLTLQAQTGAGQGLFLTHNDPTLGVDDYWLRDTAEALQTLEKVDPVTYASAITQGTEALQFLMGFYPTIPDSLPAGVRFIQSSQTWEYLPWFYMTCDQAKATWLFAKSQLKTDSSNAAEYLVQSQRTTPGKEGWFTRNGDWIALGAAPDSNETLQNDAASVQALAARLALNPPPFLLAAGWMNTNVTGNLGGVVRFNLYAEDPDGNPLALADLWYKGVPLGITLQNVAGQAGWFTLGTPQDPLTLFAGGPSGNFLVEAKVYNVLGGQSGFWPYLSITN